MHSQAVVDNKSAMKELMEHLTYRVEVVSKACKEAESEASRNRISEFVRYVLQDRLFSL